MTISADYTAAPGEDPDDLGPNEFTAGSVLSLICEVQGHSGDLTYDWTVTRNPDTPRCIDCDISSTTSTLRLAQPALSSYHAGIHTCTVSESGRHGSRNSDDFTVAVVGEWCWVYSMGTSTLSIIGSEVRGKRYIIIL